MKKQQYLSTTAIALLAALASAPASAQDAKQTQTAQASQGLEEIVVTGTKRDERLVDVPVAVQVFNEATIQKAGIARPQDFLNLTSNITFIQANHAGEAFVNVRGHT